MPLFRWMKWSPETRGKSPDETQRLNSPGDVPSRTLITELLWHVEERERLARQLEREHRPTHSASGLRWFQKYPRLQTLIPSSELHQLEFLCAQIPPMHTAVVLSRCSASLPLRIQYCQPFLSATASTLSLTTNKQKLEKT